MTRQEYLLWLLAEECSEVAQRASKMSRFGSHEIQPGQVLDNTDRLILELVDLIGVLDKMVDEKMIPENFAGEELVEVKRKKIDKYMKYSEQLGILESPSNMRDKQLFVGI